VDACNRFGLRPEKTMNQSHRPAPKFSNPGRRARFSFITRDKEGNAVREWHREIPVDAAQSKSLRGMVRP
jgi:hypothetical protein